MASGSAVSGVYVWDVSGRTENTDTTHTDTAVRTRADAHTHPSAVPQLLEGHQGRVYSVAWHPHEPLLASGGADGSLRLWKARKLVL